MSAVPLVLGINRTQDASICLLHGPDLVWHTQKERITRVKQHWGALDDVRSHYCPRLRELSEPLTLIVEGYSSDREFEKRPAYLAELEATLRFDGVPRIVTMSHHLSHLYSAFFPSPFDRAAVMVLDFQGSPIEHCKEQWPMRASTSRQHLEVASFYACERQGRIKCLAKQTWNGDLGVPTGIGQFYSALTCSIFPGRGNEGKVMGLAPYGRVGALGLPPLVSKGYEIHVPDGWVAAFREGERFRFSESNFMLAADFAAEGQRAFEDALITLARHLREDTSLDALCFAGGCAMNCAANNRLLEESGFEYVFVPPAPHDGGTAVGCALYGMREILRTEPTFRWTSDYLGPPPVQDERTVRSDVARLAGDAVLIERPVALAERVAELLATRQIVGVFQGNSESGPRALGNRSILADPRAPAMWKWINVRIKQREVFAPAVREEDAALYFDVDRSLPYMQFAVDVRPPFREILGAVTHVDGTARVQTVTAKQNPFLYELLGAFGRRTGTGVVLNTSFNRREEPIVETLGDALSCFLHTDLHALAIPPLLLRKRVIPPVPV